MGFSRQEYWSGSPFSSPGNLPDPGIEPRSPALQADALLENRQLYKAEFCLSTESISTVCLVLSQCFSIFFLMMVTISL